MKRSTQYVNLFSSFCLMFVFFLIGSLFPFSYVRACDYLPNEFPKASIFYDRVVPFVENIWDSRFESKQVPSATVFGNTERQDSSLASNVEGYVAGANVDSRQGLNTRPNVVFIVLDDLGYSALGSYGSTFIQTPNMDSLAEEGVRFTHFYTNSPVCSPTRAGLLSGLHPTRFGLRTVSNANIDNGKIRSRKGMTDVTTIADVFKGVGYTTSHIGKWHIGGPLPRERGYDESVRSLDLTYVNGRFRINEEEDVRPKKHRTEALTDYAIDFIERNEDKPFFLNLWYLAPHRPVDEAPAKWKEQYPNTEKGQYAAHVSNADEQIGRILETLDKLNIVENTIVILTSDNGAYKTDGSFMFNGDLRGGKQTVYEGGIRVPLIVRWPGAAMPRSTNDTTVLGFDFLPTLAGVIGSDVSELEPDGRSFMKELLSGISGAMRDETLVWEYKHGRVNGRNYAIRQGGWKLVNHKGVDELFNLSVDPNETNNVISGQSRVVKSLEDAYSNWRLRVGEIPYTIRNILEDVEVSGKTFTFGDEGGKIAIETKTNVNLNRNTDDFTFSAWVQLSESSPGDTASYVATKGGSWRVWINEDRTVGAMVKDYDGQYEMKGTTKLAPGTWHHVALSIYNGLGGNSDVVIYIDGREEIRDVSRKFVLSSKWPLLLGNSFLFRHSFVGKLQDVRFYLVSLTQKEIQEVMNLSVPAS